MLTFCTVPQAAQFAPILRAKSRSQPLQPLIAGPVATSRSISGGMATILKRLEALSFSRNKSSSRPMRAISAGVVGSSDELMS